jgi:hypothetical protein
MMAAAATPSSHSCRVERSRASRAIATAASTQRTPTTIAAVVARPGRRTRNGAITTSAAKPVAPESHMSWPLASCRRIARPMTSEAARMRTVDA